MFHPIFFFWWGYSIKLTGDCDPFAKWDAPPSTMGTGDRRGMERMEL